jgi:hypothetical protein
MRWFSQLIVNLILIAAPVHALDVTGIVVDRSGEPISGAIVKLVGIGSDTTTQTGEFRIPIPDSRVGQRVNILIAKDGWAPASDQPLAFIVPANPVSDALRITLSKAQSFGASAEIDQPTVNFSVVSEIPKDDVSVSYSADRLADTLRIAPEVPYLDLFARGGPITPHGSFFRDPFQITLPQIDIKVTNNTNKTVFFNEAVFIIDSSHLDASPLLLIPGNTLYQMKMSFRNFGWKKITGATMTYNITRPNEPEDFARPERETLNLTEDEKGWLHVDFSDVLARLGVDVLTFRAQTELQEAMDIFNSVANLTPDNYPTQNRQLTDMQLTELRQEALNGLLSKLRADKDFLSRLRADKDFLSKLRTDKDFLSKLRAEVEQRMLKACGPFPDGQAKVVGEISYADPVDTSKRQSVRFVGFVDFGRPVLPPGPVPPTCHYSVKFDVENQNYERHISLAQALKPQEVDHFTIQIAADKSSIHRFKLRLLYNNGLVIESPTVELRLFMPRGTRIYAETEH